MPRRKDEPARFGIVLYEGVEPIDIGGTVGVISMARRVLPNIADAVIARRKGPLALAGGLIVDVPFAFADAPYCDIAIVCGGPGWPDAARDPDMLAFLRAHDRASVASVCTGALILAAAGALDGRQATTRRSALGAETTPPLARLSSAGTNIDVVEAAIVDDVVVTGGGVSLAIDVTLYLIGKLYGAAARDEIARAIEYDRAYRANAAALGVIGPG